MTSRIIHSLYRVGNSDMKCTIFMPLDIYTIDMYNQTYKCACMYFLDLQYSEMEICKICRNLN